MRRAILAILCLVTVLAVIGGDAFPSSFSMSRTGNTLWIDGDINGCMEILGDSMISYSIGNCHGIITRFGRYIDISGDIAGNIMPMGNSLLYDINGKTGIMTPLGNGYLINGDIWGSLRKIGNSIYVDIW